MGRDVDYNTHLTVIYVTVVENSRNQKSVAYHEEFETSVQMHFHAETILGSLDCKHPITVSLSHDGGTIANGYPISR